MTKSGEIKLNEILEKARKAELEEQDLVVTLGGMGERLAFARQDVDEAFNEAYYEWQRGRRDDKPVLDLSSVQGLEEYADQLKREAHAAGLRKLELYENYYRTLAQEYTAQRDALRAPLTALEEQVEELQGELEKVRDAMSDAERKYWDAYSQAAQYEQSLRLHRTNAEPIRRMR